MAASDWRSSPWTQEGKKCFLKIQPRSCWSKIIRQYSKSCRRSQTGSWDIFTAESVYSGRWAVLRTHNWLLANIGFDAQYLNSSSDADYGNLFFSKFYGNRYWAIRSLCYLWEIGWPSTGYHRISKKISYRNRHLRKNSNTEHQILC